MSNHSAVEIQLYRLSNQFECNFQISTTEFPILSSSDDESIIYVAFPDLWLARCGHSCSLYIIRCWTSHLLCYTMKDSLITEVEKIFCASRQCPRFCFMLCVRMPLPCVFVIDGHLPVLPYCWSC